MSKEKFPRHNFKPAIPSDSLPSVTANQRRLMARYTQIEATVVEDMPDAHTAWLVAGGRKFCVSIMACEDADHASAACLLLARSLEKLIEAEMAGSGAGGEPERKE